MLVSSFTASCFLVLFMFDTGIEATTAPGTGMDILFGSRKSPLVLSSMVSGRPKVASSGTTWSTLESLSTGTTAFVSWWNEEGDMIDVEELGRFW